jgi:hypothetical protein
VKACCLFHGILHEQDGYNFDDILTVEVFYVMPIKPIEGEELSIIFVIIMQIIL